MILSFITYTTIWGSTWLVIRFQLGTVAPQWSVAYRFVIAAAAMFLVVRLSGLSPRLPKGAWPIVWALGLTQFCINFNFVYLAERHITSGLVGTIFALLLIPNSLLAWAFLGQRPSARFLIASSIAIAGIVLMFAEELRANAAERGEVLLGILLAIGGMLGASMANVLQARKEARHIPLPVLLAWSMLCGVLIDAALALAVAGPPRWDWSPSYVLGLIYLALLASALAFSLYFPVVRRIGPARAAYSSAIVPIIAMTLSTLFEGYRWTWPAAVGALLTIGGMLIALSSRTPVVPAAPAD